MPSPSEFAILRDPDSRDFAALLDLYEQALPASERKSTEALRAMCTSQGYRVVIAHTADGFAGFAILNVGPKIVLLEYMAIGTATRGHGIGSALYRWTRARCVPPALPVFAEVDSEREQTPDRHLRIRRKQFYRQLGFRQVLGLNYLLPLPTDEPPPLMDLLVDGSDASVPRDIVAAWLREIYASAYGCDGDDSRLSAMIQSLPVDVLVD